MDTRKVIDYAYDDNAIEMRNVLYSSIHDKVMAHLEQQKQQIAKTLITPEEVQEEVYEEVEEEIELDEGIMTGITLGKKVKNGEGGHNQDVYHKGKNIGQISSYSHRTGLRYGMKHHDSNDKTAGSRSHDEALDDLRHSHAEHLKSMRNEDVELDEATHDTHDRDMQSIQKMHDVKQWIKKNPKSRNSMPHGIHQNMQDAWHEGGKNGPDHKKIDKLHKMFKSVTEDVE